MVEPLRVFISSPSDVTPERRRAALVIERLAKDYARFFDIGFVLWETEPMLASGHFQDHITPPADTDIVVLILWSRLGTNLPERTEIREYRGIDGRVPVTGTEWEFESALAAQRLRNAPDILAYRKAVDPTVSVKNKAAKAAAEEQWEKLENFWERHFLDRGMFRAAFSEFSDVDAFAQKIESDLRRLIELRIAAIRAGASASASAWLTGNPFRGLETYCFEHAAIFFGRSEVITTAVEQLIANADAERPFLLILGASGAGKSSLAQAGILPALMGHGVVPQTGEWRRAIMRPSGQGPFLALAQSLVAADALPELVESGQTVLDLARHLDAAAEHAAFPIVSALTARERTARARNDMLSFEQTRLALVVDQLEELFTHNESTVELRRRFIQCLDSLVRSGRVFVIATMRSDYWHRAAEVPLLVELAAGKGRLDLVAPKQAEVAEMIRRPAEAAGLAFETDPRNGIRLDAALAEEAAHEPGALPLLSYLLDALYIRDVRDAGGAVLSYASMRALGGLKGAIAQRAEAAFTALPSDVQASLPKVLRALVRVSRSDAAPVARAASMSRFPEGRPERKLVEAMLAPDVRLLVADGDGEGARIRLAHEALLSHWQEVSRQIVQDRIDLRTLTAVEGAEAEWRAASQLRGYLLRDPQLANAIDLEKRWGEELDASTRSFIQQSRRRAQLRQQLTAAAAIVFAFVAVAAVFAQQQAARERARAERSYAAAKSSVATLVFGVAEGLRHVDSMNAETIGKVLDTTSDTIAKLAADNPVDRDLQRLHGAMANEFALTYQAAGDSEHALQSATASLAFARQLAQAEPANPASRHELAARLSTEGELRLAVGEVEAARGDYDEALAIRRALAASEPDNTTWQEDLSASLNTLGDLRLRADDVAGARSAYREMLDIRRRLAAREPDSAVRQIDVASSLEKIADMERRVGLDRAAAIAAFDELLAIDRKVAAADPDNVLWQRNLASGLYKSGDLKMLLRDFAAAQADYESMLDIFRDIAKRYPDSIDAKRDVASGLERIGDLNRRSTKLETARDFYGQMLDIFREVAAQAPDVVQWQRAVAVSLGKIANTNFIMGDYKAAESSYQEVLQQFRKLATADPANNDAERDVAQTLTHIGDVRWQRDDRGGANQPYEEALRITRNLLRQDPENLDWQMDLVTALRDSAYTASDPVYVRELLDEGSALARSLAANELLSPEYRPTLNTVAADLTALAERGRAR